MSEVIKLNDTEYEFNCTFFNATQGDNSVFLNSVSYNAFEYLEIVDAMFSPFLQCRFAIDNPLNFIEKQPGPNPFTFNSNNRNLCNLSLVPVGLKRVNKKIAEQNILKIFGVLNEGAVLSSDKNDASILCFDLIDTKEAALTEQKVGYKYPKINTSLTIGANIKEILKQAHPGVPDSTIFDEKFNLGDVQITTQYLFPLSYTLLDAINFLLPFNIATVNNIESQLFLKYNYDKKKYFNYSVYDFFNNATSSDVNQETFILGGKEGAKGAQTNSAPGGVSKTLKDNILHNVGFSNVNFNVSNTEFLPIYCATTTQPDDINTVKFFDIVEARTLFEDNVLKTESMKSIYGNDILLNVDLDESKTSQQNYKIIATQFNDSINEKLAKAQLYNSFIFQNMTLNFTVPGQPYRQAGVFINIVRATDTDGKEFDKKLLGQWLVTDVIHRIVKGTYTTHIQCVKPFKIGTRTEQQTQATTTTPEGQQVNQQLQETGIGQSNPSNESRLNQNPDNQNTPERGTPEYPAINLYNPNPYLNSNKETPEGGTGTGPETLMGPEIQEVRTYPGDPEGIEVTDRRGNTLYWVKNPALTNPL